MSGTFTSDRDGDWSTATIWNTDTVPDSSTADVTIDTSVTVSAGESFTAGTLDAGTLGVLDLLGSLDVTAGVMVDGGVSLDGGLLTVGAGLTLTTISSLLGGGGTVVGDIDNAGLIAASDGLLDLAGSVNGSGPLEINLATGTSATLELGQGGTEAVAFVGLNPLSSAQGVLKLDQPGAYSGTISGFAFNEAIDLAGFSPGSLSETFSGTPELGTLAIANGASTVASLSFAGNYTNVGFTLMSDGQSGTDVELVPPAAETAVSSGDWRDATIWSASLVPDNAVTQVNIVSQSAGPVDVTIAGGESFVAGGVSLAGGASLGVIGSLTVAGPLTVGSGGFLALGIEFGNPSSGLVDAANVDVAAGGELSGVGTVASSGTLINDGQIRSQNAQLTLAPAVYQQGTSGGLFADGDTLIVAPSSGFTNLADGTLSGGTYEAESTLILPGPVSEIAGSTVDLGGTAEIESGGVPIQDTLRTVGSGAQLGLRGYDYASANTLTVSDGSLDLLGSTLDVAELILAGGSSELSGSGVVSGNIENNGLIAAISDEPGIAGSSILDLAGPVTGSGALEIGGASTLQLSATTNGEVTFDVLQEPPGVLRLDDPGAFAGTISGFTAGLVPVFVGRTFDTIYVSDTIDLPGFAPGTLSEVYNGTTAGGVLDILAPDSIVASLSFVGDYTHDSFTLVGDGSGGTDIGLLVPIPCFVRGTRIATAVGEMAAEELRVGDRVLTASGDTRPIVWIGQRRVDCRRHPRPELVQPIRIRAGAFAASRPARDLWLSPGHSVFCGGVLIPVELLINGATVVQEQAAGAHYFHIELDRHDIVLAEGLAAESYLDDGNRAAFENGAVHLTLHPEFVPLNWDAACAPRCTEGAKLLSARRLLFERALQLGYRVAADSDLRAVAAGAAVPPASVIHMKGKLYRHKGTLCRFMLPAQAREVRLVSPTGVPVWFDAQSADRRQLGARIGAIYLDERTVPLTSRLFAEGFHAIERLGGERWRWTNGAARLRLPEQPGRRDPMALDVFVRDLMRCWHMPAETVRVAADRIATGRLAV